MLLVVGGVAQQLSSERTEILAEARQHTSNLARALQEHIRRTLKEVDQALLVLKRSSENDPQNFKLWEWPGRDLLLQDLSAQIEIINRDGILLGTIDGPAAVKVSVRNADYFLHHVDHDDNALFFGKPIAAGPGHWLIPLSRRLDDADGSFAGVVVVLLDAYYLARFYETVDLGHEGTVMLVGRDGVVRARVTFGSDPKRGDGPRPSITIGETVILKLAPDLESQTTHSPSPLDNVQRVITYDVLKDYPLVVGVGLADDDLFADYNASRWRLISAATLVSLLVVGFTALLARQMLRRQRSEAELAIREGELRGERERLSDALDSLRSAMTVFARSSKPRVTRSSPRMPTA